jgi:hypothetical protein
VKAGCRKPGDCFTDSDCPSTAACVDNRCRNPCENPKACGRNAECLPTAHTALCHCPAQTRGDAKVRTCCFFYFGEYLANILNREME